MIIVKSNNMSVMRNFIANCILNSTIILIYKLIITRMIPGFPLLNARIPPWINKSLIRK